MKPLDFVMTPKGGIGLITETNDGGKQASIEYIYNPNNEYNAWWYEKELKVLISLPRLLALSTCHPFGGPEGSSGYWIQEVSEWLKEMKLTKCWSVDGLVSDLNNENKVFYEVEGELKCFIIHEGD